MAKKSTLSRLVNVIVWLTGILVALAVGFGMAQGTLVIPWLNAVGASIVTVIAGWIVIILTVIGAILALLNQ